MKDPEEKLWLIWSNEHKAWWGEDSCGYVTKRSEAGRYSYEEAFEIVDGANFGKEDEPMEALVPL